MSNFSHYCLCITIANRSGFSFFENNKSEAKINDLFKNIPHSFVYQKQRVKKKKQTIAIKIQKTCCVLSVRSIFVCNMLYLRSDNVRWKFKLKKNESPILVAIIYAYKL